MAQVDAGVAGGRGRVGEAIFQQSAVLDHAVVMALALAHETVTKRLPEAGAKS